MKKVVIVDGDILTPLGNLERTWKTIIGGKTGLKMQKLGLAGHELPIATIDQLDGPVGSLQRQQSLFDTLFKEGPEGIQDAMLFCATTKGAVDELMRCPDNVAGQPWQIAHCLADRLGLPGKGSTVSGACASGLIAIIQAAMNIKAGNCDRALVLGFDLVSEFVVAGFDSLKSLSPERARPFDKNRNGLSIGEGGGWLLLSAEDAISDTSPVMARIENWAISCDATHITAPCRYASGLKRALGNLVRDLRTPLGGINAHGTGTIYNDAMELLAFRDTCDEGIPVCSVKGALGHSLAATGIIETLLSARSLGEMTLLPTTGLEEPEESSCRLSGSEALPLRYPTILTCNSGFGGVNAALLMSSR